MIKTFTSLTLASLIAITISGCGEKEPQAPKQKAVDIQGCMIDDTRAPKWACVPMYEGSYASIGVAMKSAAGDAFMRKRALASGRDDLAQQIEIDVKNKMESFTRSTGTTEAESVDMVATAVSKQVSHQVLKGSSYVDYWQSPKGTIYLLVTMPKQTVNEEAKKAVKKSISSFKNDDALWQQFQSEQAQKSLEKEFPTD
jgi:uncharacterized lipoprotein YehR (DUF1307 family)